MNAIKEDTEQKILDAARKVFIEKGLAGARMQEIADEAGINKALLHYYYRSKDKLFDAIFDEVLKGMIPMISELIFSSDSIEVLIPKIINVYNDTFRKNPFMPQFFFHEIWQHPDKLALMFKSNNIDPKIIQSKMTKELNSNFKSEFIAPHFVANILGMCLFPFIARPLFQRIFFDNNSEKYDEFLGERSSFLQQQFAQSIKLNTNSKL